ncbi:MAG TPA: hypothetical protein VHE23_02575, partial [Candidatus Acidoferrales bacterium]|nr:hypothetical protein [Candidatus Acidoferrales bacterium]
IALEKSPLRLHEDHANARRLAEGLAALPGLRMDAAKVKTNIVIFGCERSGKTAVEVCAALRKHGIWALDTAPFSVRFVTHCDVDRDGIERTLAALKIMLST